MTSRVASIINLIICARDVLWRSHSHLIMNMAHISSGSCSPCPLWPLSHSCTSCLQLLTSGSKRPFANLDSQDCFADWGTVSLSKRGQIKTFVAVIAVMKLQHLGVDMLDCRTALKTSLRCFWSLQWKYVSCWLRFSPSSGSDQRTCCVPGLLLSGHSGSGPHYSPLPHSWTASSLTSLLNSICQRKGSMRREQKQNMMGTQHHGHKRFLTLRVKLGRGGDG